MTEHKRAIFPEGGPKPGGPYSPGIVSGGFVFTAGQVGTDPATGQVAGETIEAQTRQVMKNLQSVLRAAGCDFKDVVKTLAFVTKAELFSDYNKVYKEFVPEPFPARSTVVCQLAGPEYLVEIEMVAKIPE
jgi:2-iminobutanoate/2-iminopropanoate deaminase